MSEQKDAGAMVRLAYQAMCNLGLDAEQVIKRSGLNPEELYDSKLRTPHWAQSLFWEAAEDISNDVNIGISLGAKMPIFKGIILEYLFISSAHFGDGLRRMLNYQRLISDALSITLEDEGDNPYIAFSYPDSDLRHLIECTGIVLTNFLRFVSDNGIEVSRVDFTHAKVSSDFDYDNAFQCQVCFDQEENRIYFPKSSMTHRSLHTQPELLSFHEQLVSAQLADLERQDLISEVQQQIARLLESGEVCVETVASELDIAPRSLRAQLQEAGTSFSQVLNDYRHHLAKKLLAKTEESIAEIVYLTGFSEPSTFYRAFKRWEGLTPVEYRKRKRDEQQETV